MTLNSESLLVDTFIESYKIHLKKYNKISSKNYSVYDQQRKLKKLRTNVKIDIKQYKKGFTSSQKDKCNIQFNDLIELNSKIKERCKLLEKEITKIELKEYDPYPYSDTYIDPNKVRTEVEDFILGIKAESQKKETLSQGEPKELELCNFIFNVKDKGEFLKDLKNTFQTEVGVEIKGMIELLKDNKIIIIGNRQFKRFTELLGNYLDRHIGSYQSINDAKQYSNSSMAVNKKLEPLIFKHKQPN